MTATIDDAERLLVSASFAEASAAASAARLAARDPADRVAAECVWIQAEFKLGALSTHDADAARMLAGTTLEPGGATFEPASLVLWCKLRLHDADDAAGEEAGEAALWTMFERAKERCAAAPSTSSPAAAASTSSPSSAPTGGGTPRAEDETSTGTIEDDIVMGTAAWMYAVHLLCERRKRPDAAAKWLQYAWGFLPPDARERLTDSIVSYCRAGGDGDGGGSGSGGGEAAATTAGIEPAATAGERMPTPSPAPGSARRARSKPGRGRSAAHPRGTPGEEEGAGEIEIEAAGGVLEGDANANRPGTPPAGTPPPPPPRSDRPSTLSELLAAVAESVDGLSFSKMTDATSPTFVRDAAVGGVAAVLAGVAAYAVFAEARGSWRRWRARRGRM
mgnify:CR=1 FL=1